MLSTCLPIHAASVMTEELIALGRRAVACKDWRWMPGMLTVVDCGDGGTCTPIRLTAPSANLEWLGCSEEDRPEYGRWIMTNAIPDPSDPSTCGAMLVLIATAHGVTVEDVSVVRTTGRVWSVWIHDGSGSSHRVTTHLDSRAEALVAALEAA